MVCVTLTPQTPPSHLWLPPTILWVPRTGVLLLHSFLRMVMRMVTFLQERPSSLPRGTGWVRQPWLRHTPRGNRMDWRGAISVMLEGPSTSVSGHAEETLPIRGKAFNSVSWKEVVAGEAGETEEDACGAMG